MKNRSKMRETIITIIYQVLLYLKNEIDFDLELVIKDNSEIQNDFINETVEGIIDNIEDLSILCNKYLTNWTMDRLGPIDQAILLLGSYELMYTETPPVVAINEAIELSKNYSDDNVKKMINGVLDKIYHEESKQ